MFRIALSIALGLAISFCIISYFEWDNIKVYLPTPPTSAPTPYPTVLPVNLNENKLFELVQKWRQSQGLSLYTKSVVTCGIASIRLDKIKEDWTHNDFYPIAQSNNWWGYREIGENLTKEYRDELSALNGWIKSASHLKELEKPFTEGCIHCDGTYCVQIFAR